MSASFIKRLKAYLIDIFIVSLIFSVISINYSNSRIDDYDKESRELMDSYVNGDISSSKYLDEYASIAYDIEKSSLYINTLYVVVSIGYFMIFQYLNKGQSIGKKLFGIKIVNKDKEDVSFLQMFIRTCIINEILLYVMMLILVIGTNYKAFFIGYSIIRFIMFIIIISSVIMINNRKDRKGIHDILSCSYVMDLKEDI